MAEDLVGTTLAERYDVLELLGRGGMGAVYRVLDRELDEIVALKVIRGDLAEDREMVERFRTEVRLARRVTHANVARTFELGRSEQLMFCTLELVEGESLSEYVKRRGALPLPEAASIASTVCEALVAAHAAGVIHRDIKPGNIMVTPSGRVVVTDFGIASLVVGDAGAEGTPPYMAPEQILGASPTPAVDVYAVGVVFGELVTGRPLFDGNAAAIFTAKQTLDHVEVTGVPADVASTIARATARDASARIASASALRRELARWLPAGEQQLVPRAVARTDTEHATPSPPDRVIIVQPPRGEPAKLYIAEAIHAELLQRLARTPWVRVQTSGEATITVDLVVTDDLLARIAGFELRVPLALEHIGAAVDSIAAAISAVLEPQTDSLPALDLVLRARHGAQSSVGRLASGVELLQQAAELAPDSALVAALLATAKLQRAFFASDGDSAALDDAERLVGVALARAPTAFETHMAAGHLELHRGIPAVAAMHFRSAIARAPHSADAHEQLGRMLLEAGHLEQGFARLTDALAIAPDRRSARWEMSRARALAGDWDEHDRLVAEAIATGSDALLPRIRFITWRGAEYARYVRAQALPMGVFEPEAVAMVFEVVCDGAWPKHRERLLATALESTRPSRRRRAFVAQLVAEAAGIGGDAVACEATIAYAIDYGLFDLHWLDVCTAIAIVRERPSFAKLRAVVKERADQILDALYGDVVGVSDTTTLAPTA